MKLAITVCDVCQDPEASTQQYELKSQGKNVKVDLCEAHAQPFEAYLKDAKPRGRAASKAANRGGRRSTRVATIEEIEAKKKKA